MKIVNIRPIPGPNVYSHRPVLVMKLELEDLTGRESCEFPGFNERLWSLLPGVRGHHCSKGYAGGFVERLEEGTYFGHIVEHVALELTELAGVPTFHGKTRQAGGPGGYNVIVEYKAEKGTEYLLRTAVELVQAVLDDTPFPLSERIAEAREVIARTELGPSTRTIVEAAVKRGIPYQRLDEQSLVQLGYGKNRRLIAAATTSQTGAIATDIASDKDLTKRLLDRAGIPVPRGEIVQTREDAVKVLEWLHKPVAVKPFDGHQGQGVSLNLFTPEQVQEAFEIAREHSADVLVEELFVGRDFRVLVVGGKMIAASERLPAKVIGDGQHTVAELIEIENQNPLRGVGHDFPLSRIIVDDVMIAYLHKSGLSLQDVPEPGRTVFLRESANLSKGGTAKDVTDAVHPSVKRICERAAQVVGLDICGIDLVLPSITEPIRKGGAGIIEINAAPGLRMHVFPSEGEPRDVGAAIVQMLYPFGSAARIPIISVTGTNGKTTITRLISHLLFPTGQTIGMTTTDGIYLNGELIVEGDTTGPRSAQVILSDPTVEVAVLEVARGGIMRAGLAYDWSDISVMSNIQPDHIGQDGIASVDDLLYVKSLVAERVREGGTLILNADDERLARLMEKPRLNEVRKKVVYYSLDAANPVVQQHVEQGGTAFRVEQGWLTAISEGEQRRLVEAVKVPLTLGGKADYQTSNALAAVAAARAYGLDRERVVQALVSYSGGEQNAGRGNLYRLGQGYIYVDYGHNPKAFAAVGKALKDLTGGRISAVIGVPGDRNDDIVREAGRVAAQAFDRLIIREDKDLRGRPGGEAAKLLFQAAQQVKPGMESNIVLDETEAIKSALRTMSDGEIVAIFYENLESVREILGQQGAQPTLSVSAANDIPQGKPVGVG